MRPNSHAPPQQASGKAGSQLGNAASISESLCRGVAFHLTRASSSMSEADDVGAPELNPWLPHAGCLQSLKAQKDIWAYGRV